MKTYPKMKETSIPWIGKIPEHWGMKPLFTVLKERKEKNRGNRVSNLLSLSYGRIIEKDINSNEGLLPESFETYQIVENKNIILRLTDLQNDQRSLRVGQVRAEIGIITSAYVCLEGSSIDKDYAFALLFALDLQKVFYGLGNGVRQSMGFEDLKRLPLPLPPLDEQQAIATYLDKAAAKIDALIAEQEKLCTLLAEKRKALISHVVTRGLDPKAKLKPSGISWLGDIPEHWEVKPLKYIVSIPITDGPHETPELYDDGVPFLSAEAVSNGVLDFEKKRGYISKEDYVKFSLKYIPKVYDIFMIKSGATTGVTAIVETDTVFTIWSPLAVIRSDKKKAFPYYILAALRSDNFQKAVALNWNFGTQQNIGMKVLENIRIPLPTLPEQLAIAAYLDKATAKLDALAAKAEEGIALLKERRAALISEVVTGKVRVA